MLKAMLGEASQAMGANRLRSGLTMLGMVIGVGSVVLMLAIGQGAQYSVAQTIGTHRLPGLAEHRLQHGVPGRVGSSLTSSPSRKRT